MYPTDVQFRDRARAANEYPTEEESEEINFFPVRDPGDFPSVGSFHDVCPSHSSCSFLMQISRAL